MTDAAVHPPRSPAKTLRDLLARPGIIRSIGAHDVLTAMLLERAGFETVFLGGFGSSPSLHGLPDLGFLGLDEMAAAVRRMARRLSIPAIADGDTGHGDLHNVARTVEEFERAGAVQFFARVQILPFAEDAAARFDVLRGLKLKGRKLDLRIAAIVLVERETLVTRNRSDSGQIPGLALEDWSS
jgi:predicted nucleic acid-binding protein